MIQFNGIVILHSDTEVVHPSVKIRADFTVPASHRDAPTATGKSAQFGLETCEGLLRDGKLLTSEGESKETTLFSLHHPAFVSVNLYLEDFLKVTADTVHHAVSGTFRLYKDGKVSRPAEQPRQSLAEPDVNLSAHPAPIIQPPEVSPSASEQTTMAPAVLSDQAIAQHSDDGVQIVYTSCAPNAQALYSDI
jgi:hypothetical protein